MKTISFRNRAISKGSEIVAEAILNDGKNVAAVKGLTGKRCNQLLRTIGVSVTPTAGLTTIPIGFLQNLPVMGEIEFMPKGSKYQYTQEDIDRFAKDGVAMQGHTTAACKDDLENCVANKDYYNPEACFRVNDVRSIIIEPNERVYELLMKFPVVTSAPAVAASVDAGSFEK